MLLSFQEVVVGEQRSCWTAELYIYCKPVTMLSSFCFNFGQRSETQVVPVQN